MRLKNALKHAGAVALALFLLNAFCLWYYDQPPLVRSASRATDVVRQPFARKSQAREGWSGLQWMDANGYNNESARAPGEIDILFMGSSHLEGASVRQKDNAAVLLEAELRANGREGNVYNIGMSAHTLPRNAANLARALAQYRPGSYVIIETASVVFSGRAIEAARNDAVARVEADGLPVPGLLSDRPLFRNAYKQTMELISAVGAGEDAAEAGYKAVPEDRLEEYETALAAWFAELCGTAEASGVRLILCYHPHLVPQRDGSVRLEEPESNIRAFASACQAAGVRFVNLSERFVQAYAEARVLPHGFANTALGVGHLNADGQRLMAEALAAAILEMEGDAP